MGTTDGAEMVGWADKIVRAAEQFADALPHSEIALPMVKCSRCNGKGEAYFCGGNRAPGVCFKCYGKGRVAKPGTSELRARDAFEAAREVEALRVLYRGLTLAISVAREAEKVGHWSASSVLENLLARRSRLVDAGKKAVAA